MVQERGSELSLSKILYIRYEDLDLIIDYRSYLIMEKKL